MNYELFSKNIKPQHVKYQTKKEVATKKKTGGLINLKKYD